MGWSVAQNGEKEMSNGQNGAELRLVTPGMAIGPVAGKRVGSGAIAQNDTIIATRLGWTKEFNNTVSVDPINSAYMPRSGDLIVAVVAEVRNNLWFMNINGPFQGLLPMSLAPWKVEFGAARQHMGIGDVVLARVQEVDECHNVVLTMKGVGLRRLNQGTVVNVPINHIDRLARRRQRNRSTPPGCGRQSESSSERTDESGSTAMLKAPHGPARAVALTQASGHKTTFEAELSALEQNAPKKGDA